jgi:MULE transposase domain
VVEDRRWQELLRAPETKHKTGPDPRNRTLVVTSYTLLHNLVHARNAGWNILASIDGTHKVSNTSYILHAVGVNGIGRHGHRRFYPVAYGFGEGEREIVAIHTILNVQYAAAKLFGLVDIKFNGGIVSDRSNALLNACLYCFPGTPMLQCYTHIIRKFKAYANAIHWRMPK